MICLLVAALLGSVVLLLPSATITIAPSSTPVQTKTSITADLLAKNTDYGQAIVPAVGGGEAVRPGGALQQIDVVSGNVLAIEPNDVRQH